MPSLMIPIGDCAVRWKQPTNVQSDDRDRASDRAGVAADEVVRRVVALRFAHDPARALGAKIGIVIDDGVVFDPAPRREPEDHAADWARAALAVAIDEAVRDRGAICPPGVAVSIMSFAE
jgi:hypothetical protein